MTSIEGAPAQDGPEAGRAAPGPDVRGGVLAALGAYGMWGGFPLFFKLLEGIDPANIVAHRTVFGLIFVACVLFYRRQVVSTLMGLRHPKTLMVMALSTLLLGTNWLIFVWAIEAEQVLQASFGYFITPLVNIAIGMLFLGERQNRLQYLAIAFALVAVAIQAVGLGAMPWVALTLALTFGFYGFLRKTVSVGSVPGLFIETLLLTPFALAYIAWTLTSAGPIAYADPVKVAALIISGPLTAVALIFFAYAARQLRMTAIGMFQYIAPSLQFLSAVILFGEPLNPVLLLSFALIWVSLGVFSWDSFRRRQH